MAGNPKLTLCVMTADVGGFVGHVSSHPDILDTAKERLYDAREKGTIVDFHVLRCGDDLELIITHMMGSKSREIHELGWNIFSACQEVAKELKLHAHGQGMSKEAFTGSLEGMGPGFAEMEFVERSSEPVVILMLNKASTGSWNFPLYKAFADPFNTSGLILEPSMLEGFSFNVRDIKENRAITLSAPAEMYSLLSLIGSTSRYKITSVNRNSDCEQAAAVSTQKLTIIGNNIIGSGDPAIIIRCQSGFPAVGEIMEAFSFPYLVEGWMRGSHIGTILPVPFYEANPTRFDGPPRVIGAGFQVTNGRLIGPHDMFDDPSFDETRKLANEVTEYLRRNGPFRPHRLPESEMEHTAVPLVMNKLKDRFKKL